MDEEHQTPVSQEGLSYRQFLSPVIGPQLAFFLPRASIDYYQDFFSCDKHQISPLKLNGVNLFCETDQDAAYAQFEQVRLRIPPDKPLAVQQWRGLIAVNYPARAFGITRHLPFDEARKKCPELICVHVATYAQGEGEVEAKYHENPKPETHKVSLDPYRRESVKVLKIFAESCPTIEKASIDEAFLDFSVPVREILRSRYPHIFGSKVELDTPLPPPPQLNWQQPERDSGSNIIASDVTYTTWSDLALAVGAELMADCRRAVFDQLGYTCSAGIATNKMLAKLCSAYKKPNAQTVLRSSAVKEFLRPLEVSKVRFLGGKLGQSVIDILPSSSDNQSGSRTLGEVWKLSLNQLQDKLGEESGMWVWDIVRGVDTTEVEPKTQVKSMMSCKNFRPSISTLDEGVHWLRILATDLFARLSEARQNAPGIWVRCQVISPVLCGSTTTHATEVGKLYFQPKTIVIHRRDGSHNTTAKQIAFPYTSNLTHDYIFSHGQKLLHDFVIRSSDSSVPSLGQITSLGLAFQTLERLELGQRGIEMFLAPKTKKLQDTKSIEHEQATTSSDSVSLMVESTANKAPKREHSDNSSTKPLVLPKRQKKDISQFFARPTIQRASLSSTSQEVNPDILQYTCRRCQVVLSVDREDVDHQSELTKLKTEHDDEHFARDLWQQDRNQSSTADTQISEQPPTKKKKKKTSGSDISSFFTPSSNQSSRKKSQ